MKKVIPMLYFVLLDVCIVLMITGLLWGKTDIFSRGDAVEKTQITPTKKVQVTDDLWEYYLQIESPDGISMTLEFYTAHQAVRVYANEKVIYAFEGPGSIWGSSSGSKYHFVTIPVDVQDIKVQTEALYIEDRNRPVEFYIGDGIAMLGDSIRSSIPNMVLSLISIVTGLFLVVYWIIIRKKMENRRGVVYFGLFITVLGFWTLHETDFITLLVVNRTASSYCGYLFLMLAIVPFVLFVKHFMQIEDKWIYQLICAAAMLNLVINTAGHMLGWWYFKKTVTTIHISIVLALGYMLYAVIMRYRKYGMDQKVKTNLAGTVVLGATVVIDLFAYYMNFNQADVIGRVGILVYVILLGKEITAEFFRQIDEGRKAEIYRELAVKDVMTGLYNRNAFDEWEYSCEDFNNVMLVTFDLNNLKLCNDTMGHDVGDRYIIDSADLILKVFGKIAKCYRIGGDEFCAVLDDGNHINIEERLLHLRNLQELYNQTSKDITMQIACGYAAFNEVDLNIEETRSRADARMYANKKTIKAIKQ